MEITLRDDDIASIFDKGLQAHNAGDLIAAEQLYQETLSIQPNHCEANHNIGVVLAAKNKLDEALKFFKYALDSSPNVSLFWASYIDALIKLERIAESKTLIKAVKDAGISCDKIEAISQRLDVEHQEPGPKDTQELNELIELQKFDEAIQACLSLMDTYPSSAVLNINLGKCYFELGQINQSISSYKKGTQYQPSWAVGFAMLGHLYSSQGNANQAIASLKTALGLQPDDQELNFTLGVELFQNEDVDEAIKYLKKALTQEPNSSSTLSILGGAYSKKGDHKLAISYYKKALKLDPNDEKLHFNIGNALQAEDSFDTAIKSYQQAIKIKPNDADVYTNMGVAFKAKGDLDAAITSFKQALKINPKHAETYNNMGIAFYDQGDFFSAIQNLKQAIKTNPNYVQAYQNLLFPIQAIKFESVSVENQLSSVTVPLASKFAQIAKSVLSYRLNLGGPSAEKTLKKVLRLMSSSDNIIIQNPNPNSKKSKIGLILPDSIIALVHFGRSGTGLAHSLIDNHPEVSTLPSYYFNEFFDHANWEKLIEDGWSQLADQFIKTYTVLFDASTSDPIPSLNGQLIDNMGLKEGLTTLGQTRDQVLTVDKTTFRKELIRLMEYYTKVDRFTFFKLVHSAYEFTLNRDNVKKLLFYHIHNPSNDAQLSFLQSAPNAKWIMMVREPIQSCESWVRPQFNKNDFAKVVAFVLDMLFKIDSVIFKNKNAVGVRLEDLKEHPRKTIPALCEWMDIEETESLYEMTAQGEKWWGDRSSQDYFKDGMNPFGTKAIRRKVGSIFSESDQFILRTLFYPFSVRFGYVKDNASQFKVDLQAIRPKLDTMFDFEKVMAERKGVEANEFMKSGSYLYFRVRLIDRWNVLHKHGTYPEMLRPLQIKGISKKID